MNYTVEFNNIKEKEYPLFYIYRTLNPYIAARRSNRKLLRKCNSLKDISSVVPVYSKGKKIKDLKVKYDMSFMLNNIPKKYNYDFEYAKKMVMKSNNTDLKKLYAFLIYFKFRKFKNYNDYYKKAEKLKYHYTIRTFSILFFKSKFDNIKFKSIDINKTNYSKKLIEIANINNQCFGSYLESLFCHLIEPKYYLDDLKDWKYNDDFNKLKDKLKYLYRSNNLKYEKIVPSYLLRWRGSKFMLKINEKINVNFMLKYMFEMMDILPNKWDNIYINLEIGKGFCDFIIDDTIYEVKCYKKGNEWMRIGFVQSLIYVSRLMIKNNVNIKKINKICVINLLLGKYFIVDISKVKKYELCNFYKYTFG